MEASGSQVRSKVVKSKYTGSVVVRVHKDTARVIRKELERLNKKDLGKRIVADDLIALAVSKFTDEDRITLQNKTLSNSDRIEMLYREHLKNGHASSKEEFLGMLLQSKVFQARG